jgi:hypothetical protein
MESSSPCEIVLSNIRACLHKCTNNEENYLAQQNIVLNECKNIEEYKHSLKSTKTQIIWDNSFIPKDSSYTIDYDSKGRILFIHTKPI